MNNYFDDKPKAFVDKKTCAWKLLEEMLKKQPELYDQCIRTPFFAFEFSQLANRAIHFDYLLSKGIIPKDYLNDFETEELFKG